MDSSVSHFGWGKMFGVGILVLGALMGVGWLASDDKPTKKKSLDMRSPYAEEDEEYLEEENEVNNGIGTL